MDKYHSKLKMRVGEFYFFPVRNNIENNIEYKEGKVLGSGKTSDDIHYVETTVGNYTNKFIVQTSGYVEEVLPSQEGKLEEIDYGKRGKVEEVNDSLAGKLQEV